jgi:hypothetical protein
VTDHTVLAIAANWPSLRRLELQGCSTGLTLSSARAVRAAIGTGAGTPPRPMDAMTE